MNSRMVVVTMANLKGGCGKTTLTQNMAVQLEADGRGRVALIDGDAPQGSLSLWWNGRQVATPAMAEVAGGDMANLPETLKRLAEDGFRWCLIDTGPHHPELDERVGAAIRVADLVVIPCKPSIKDVRAAEPTVLYVMAHQRPFVFVVNEAKPNTRALPEAMASMSAYGRVAPFSLGSRQVYMTADNDNRAAVEIDAQSVEEVKKLTEFMISTFGFQDFMKKEKARV